MRLSRVLFPTLLAACASFAAVHTDYDHKADFARYRTYSWIGVRAGDSQWQERIAATVDAQLAAKGWKRVASGGNASVAAMGKLSERDSLQSFYNGFPGWGWNGWGASGTAPNPGIPEAIGNVTVDVFDSATKKLIWRGAATETLSSTPEKNDKKLENAIAEMFESFPPKKKD